MDKSKASELHSLFRGLERAHGVYKGKRLARPGEKQEGACGTVHELVTDELWEQHLLGLNGLGIIPIRDDNSCYWGCIDVDVYVGLDYVEIIAQIYKYGMPLVPCRSKSGGMHLFIFMDSPVPCSIMKQKLQMLSAALGFGGSEIFPKQAEILSDRGDVGQWLNMPYYDEMNTTRYGINDDGQAYTLDEFIDVAKRARINIHELESYSISEVSDLSDGPPCLQTMIEVGFAPGCRNDSMFNFGVYLKQKSPDNWEAELDSYNVKYMSPPLSTSELSHILKSLKKKEYYFTCDKHPFKAHCNQTQCRLRKFGIGQMVGVPQLNGLTKFASTPPIWFVDVEGFGRVELTTEDLQCQLKFQRRCMESLNQMPPVVKTDVWQKLIQQLLTNVNLIEMPPEASSKGIFFQLVEQFCTSRAQAKTRDEIILGKAFTDETGHYFRSLDLMAFLDRHRFFEFKVNKVASLLKELNGESAFMKIKNKGVNVWHIPLFNVHDRSEPVAIEQVDIL